MEQISSALTADTKRETTETSPSSWKYSDPKRQAIAVQLFMLATARQATLTTAVRDAYSMGLQGFGLDDIKAAVAQIGTVARPEGRTAMPSLGEMVQACQQAAQRRHERIAMERLNQDAAYRAAHPERFVSMKEIVEEMHMMRDACEAAFGKDYRKRMVNGVELTDLYKQAMEAA